MTTSKTAAVQATAFDTHEMVVVHRAFRRETRLLTELVAVVEPGDTPRARVLAAHFADVRLGLHNHHHGEDELLWPPLLNRVGRENDVVPRMEAQHERVAATLAAVDTAMGQVGGPGRAGRGPAGRLGTRSCHGSYASGLTSLQSSD